jgi:hypothetical protein
MDDAGHATQNKSTGMDVVGVRKEQGPQVAPTRPAGTTTLPLV